MTIRSGYFKQYLHVDLSAGTNDFLPLSDAFLEQYVGGRGFGIKLLWDHLRKHDFNIDQSSNTFIYTKEFIESIKYCRLYDCIDVIVK